MTVRVAINGFGRIGRNILRAVIESDRSDIEVVAINDLGPVETNAHLLRFDSVHGRFPGEVDTGPDSIDVGRGPIEVRRARSGAAEMVGRGCGAGMHRHLQDRDKAAVHLENGAKRVLVSAPSKGADRTMVYRRQPRQPARPATDRLERLLHDQLPRPGGQGAA
jgi:glyceraldehyde 3-phosphate dehydrogenase